MPLLNICTSLGNGMTLHVALAFLSGEKEPNYAWALNSVKRLLEVDKIATPKCLLTDRELALMNYLGTLFPQLDQLLCRWHIKMNLVTKTKQSFKDQEACDEFWELWTIVLESSHEDNCIDNFAKLSIVASPEAFGYIDKAWLVWRKRFIHCWINMIPHYGIVTTSRIESSHRALKACLQGSRGDHESIFDSFRTFWEDQHSDIRQSIDTKKI